MPCSLYAEKPVASTTRVYVPGGRRVNEYRPESSVVKVLDMPFSVLDSVTFAPGTAPSDESWTTPAKEALIASVWDRAGAARSVSAAAKAIPEAKLPPGECFLNMEHPLFNWH